MLDFRQTWGVSAQKSCHGHMEGAALQGGGVFLGKCLYILVPMGSQSAV